MEIGDANVFRRFALYPSRRFYARLLAVLRRPVVRDGRWQLLDCTAAWEGNSTWDCFLAYAWQGPGGERLLVVVNYAPNQSQCTVRLSFDDLAGSQWRLEDLMRGEDYDREGADLQSRGFYVDMPPWKASVFRSINAEGPAPATHTRSGRPLLPERERNLELLECGNPRSISRA